MEEKNNYIVLVELRFNGDAFREFNSFFFNVLVAVVVSRATYPRRVLKNFECQVSTVSTE